MVRLPSAIKRVLDEIKKRMRDSRQKRRYAKVNNDLQVLAENSPVGIFQTDMNGSTIYVNPQWCKIAGLSEKEAMGTGWLNAVHSEDRERLESGWKKATQVQNNSYAEYRFVHKDGAIAWVIGQAIPVRDSKNTIIGYVGTITDITERKVSRRRIQFRNLLMSTQQEVSIDGILVTNELGKIVSYNNQFVKMWDISPDILESKN